LNIEFLESLMRIELFHKRVNLIPATQPGTSAHRLTHYHQPQQTKINEILLSYQKIRPARGWCHRAIVAFSNPTKERIFAPPFEIGGGQAALKSIGKRAFVSAVVTRAVRKTIVRLRRRDIE
jgi:hypothetical protein